MTTEPTVPTVPTEPTEPTEPGTAWAAADLAEIVTAGLHHEGALLTAGEALVARDILALPTDALELYARLLSRVGPVFRVGALRYPIDVPAAVAALTTAGMVHRVIPDDRCVEAFDVPALKAACRKLGLPVTGKRGDLVARLAGRRWVDEAVVLPAHAGLVRRLERFAFQRAWVDRRVLVLERLGTVKWATYEPTGGAGLHADRRAMLTWERAAAGALSPEEARAIALAGREARGTGRLSPWRRAVEVLLEGEPDIDTLRGLHRAGADVAPRLALALERSGRLPEALEVCRAPRDPAEALALTRTGARLARKLGRSLPPLDLREAPTRVVRVPRVDGDARPKWRVGERAHLVEDAAIALLAAAGRRAVFAENTLWTSLYALLFRDLYFLPLPGVLPTTRRDGPVDVGTPGFAARRASWIEARRREIAAEGCGPLVARWEGERLAGLSDAERVRAVAPQIPAPMVVAILDRLLEEGWSAASGLPDLLVLPGPATALPATIPERLGEHGLLVEIKGEGDSLRDGQRVWIDHLLRRSVRVELWMVRSTP